MKITTTVVHTVMFSVQAFWSEEGGMGHGAFGTVCETLIEALVQLDLAITKENDKDWVVVCDVSKQIQQVK